MDWKAVKEEALKSGQFEEVQEPAQFYGWLFPDGSALRDKKKEREHYGLLVASGLRVHYVSSWEDAEERYWPGISQLTKKGLVRYVGHTAEIWDQAGLKALDSYMLKTGQDEIEIEVTSDQDLFVVSKEDFERNGFSLAKAINEIKRTRTPGSTK